MLQSSILPLHAPTGDVTGAICLHVDITAAKRLEAQMRQGQRMESIGRMAGGIAQSYSFDLNIRYLSGTNGDTRSLIEVRQEARAYTGDSVGTSKTQAEVEHLDAGLRVALEFAGVLEHSEMARC